MTGRLLAGRRPLLGAALAAGLGAPLLAGPPAAELGVQEATRCLHGEIERGRDGWRCLGVLSAPCAGAASPEERAGCVATLAAGWSRRGRALVRRLERVYTPGEMAEIRAAAARLRAAGAARCEGLPETATARGRPAAPLGECLLHAAAWLAHLVEFHPSRLVARPEAET